MIHENNPEMTSVHQFKKMVQYCFGGS